MIKKNEQTYLCPFHCAILVLNGTARDLPNCIRMDNAITNARAVFLSIRRRFFEFAIITNLVFFFNFDPRLFRRRGGHWPLSSLLMEAPPCFARRKKSAAERRAQRHRSEADSSSEP